MAIPLPTKFPSQSFEMSICIELIKFLNKMPPFSSSYIITFFSGCLSMWMWHECKDLYFRFLFAGNISGDEYKLLFIQQTLT